MKFIAICKTDMKQKMLSRHVVFVSCLDIDKIRKVIKKLKLQHFPNLFRFNYNNFIQLLFGHLFCLWEMGLWVCGNKTTLASFFIYTPGDGLSCCDSH